MVVEILEAQGIKSATELFKGLSKSGLSSKISSELYKHEKAHADADHEGKGEFGFILTSGWVIAYYLIQGEREPETLMEIASAPGFSNMSTKDWKVYNQAWKDWLRKLSEEKNKKSEDISIENYTDLRELFAKLLSEKLDKYGDVNMLPRPDELLNYEFSDLWLKFGNLIYDAYQEVLNEIFRSTDKKVYKKNLSGLEYR